MIPAGRRRDATGGDPIDFPTNRDLLEWSLNPELPKRREQQLFATTRSERVSS